jgi:hypothetical protein
LLVDLNIKLKEELAKLDKMEKEIVKNSPEEFELIEEMLLLLQDDGNG